MTTTFVAPKRDHKDVYLVIEDGRVVAEIIEWATCIELSRDDLGAETLAAVHGFIAGLQAKNRAARDAAAMPAPEPAVARKRAVRDVNPLPGYRIVRAKRARRVA